MSKLFANPNSIFDEIADMENDERPRREDRATVSGFFNGEPPLSQEQAEEMGLKVNVNNLFGYTDLATSKEQTLSLYTKPPRLFNIGIDYAPTGKRAEWEQKASAAFNRRIKKSGRLKAPYEGVAGDSTMHGEGDFFFPDPNTPYPRHLPLSRRLVPSGAPADVNQLTHFAIQAPLSIHEIMRHIRRKSEGWNTDKLQSLSRAIFGKVEKKGDWSSRALGAIDTMNPEELEYARQEQSPLDKVYRTHVPVYYFFQADPSRDGRPLDLSIVTKIGEADSDGKNRMVLFEAEEYFPTVTDAIQPFFTDCTLGGAPAWHRVKGQGHLNYSISWHIEMLISRLMQAGMESMTQMYAASDAVNRQELERLLVKHNSILPEGVSLLENKNVQDFQGVLSVLNIFRAAAARNSQQGGASETAPDELEVQALFRQGQISAQQSSRKSNWYDSLSNLGTTMLARFTNYNVLPSDPFYSEIQEFQSEMAREKIPLYYLQKHNTTVSAYKITGDGDEAKARGSAQFAMQNIAMYPAESQQRIKRMVTGIMFDDYTLAEELVPINTKPDGSQVREADGENNTCIIQGRAPEIQDTDVDEIHVGEHLQGLQALLGEAEQLQNQSFQPKQFIAFKALGGHTIAHVQRMESMGKGDVARQLMEQIGELAKMAEKFRHNMEQQMQAEQDQGGELDPFDKAKLILEDRKLSLMERKQQFNEFMKERTQVSRETQGAIQTNVKFAEEARKEQQHKADLAERDSRLALDIRAQQQPEPATP